MACRLLDATGMRVARVSGRAAERAFALDHTKLMEPIATIAFDGPQHDDIRGANRAYGDAFEPNDAPASATDLGQLADQPVIVDGASIDSSSDVDLYRFTVGSGEMLSASLTPVGKSYLEGPQLASGACSPGVAIDTSASADLALDLLAADGTTVLASSNAHPAGIAESLAHVPLPGAAEGDPPVRTLTGLDNHLHAAETVRLGALVVTASASGELRLDGFVSHRTSFIGP